MFDVRLNPSRRELDRFAVDVYKCRAVLREAPDSLIVVNGFAVTGII